MTRLTYDQIQLSAVRVRCTVCDREFLMTAPAKVCLRCRQGKK